MGHIFSFLKGRKIEDVFVDFERAEPTHTEMQVWQEVNEVLREGEHALELINNYQGCQDVARTAMQDATPENEEAAFLALVESVRAIREFYQHSEKLKRITPLLLRTLCSPENEQKQSLEDQQALARQLAELMDFTLQFDQLRMSRPYLPNDFSFYRRLLPRFSQHEALEVNEEEANQMAMFTADHIPMMSAVASEAYRALDADPNIANALVFMSHSCYSMIKSKKYDTLKTNLLCARAMTGAIVVFDYIDPLGAFHRKSPIPTKKCVQLLKEEFPLQDALMNAIRYTTKHFNDDSTPSSLKALFD